MAGNKGIPDLADKLNLLFDTVDAPTKSGRYSNDTAAQALAEHGTQVTGVHLSHLRSGRRDNPSARLLAALADLFGVPIGYFLDDPNASSIAENLELMVALRNSRVKVLLERTKGMSPRGLGHLEAIAEQLRQMEGLDDPHEVGEDE